MAQAKKPQVRCDFCGSVLDPSKEHIMIQSKHGQFICTKCAERFANAYADIVRENRKYAKRGDEAAAKQKLRFVPSSIKKYLDDYIIGQEGAKKTIATAIFNHKMLLDMKREGYEGAEDIEKSNILMVGPSGVGKTAMIKRLAKALDVPFVIEDTTSFSSTGFVGKDLESILRDLYENADGNIERAERGIVYIDEIDKCSRKGENPSISTDPTHEALQQGLLKILEGSVVEVSEQKGARHHPNAPTFKMDTTNILFICGGAFEGIEKIIARRQKKHQASVGFGSKVVLDEGKAYNEYIDDIRTEDLKKFGMMPELLGRLPVICTLKALPEEDLIRILTEPKNSLVNQYQTLFAANGVELEFTDEALFHIAHQAIERGTGARSLRSIVEAVLADAMYEVPDEEDVCKVVVDVDENGEIKIVKEVQEEVSKGAHA